MSFAYYLSADCGNCDEEIFYGVCVTTLEYNGMPVVPITGAEQTSFHCERCGATNYTGDFELFTEGGADPDYLDAREPDDDVETEMSA